MKKSQSLNSETSEILEILQTFLRVFFFPNFQFSKKTRKIFSKISGILTWPLSLLNGKRGKKTLRLQTIPSINLQIKSHQSNERERQDISIAQVVVLPSPFNKSKYKNFSKL